jgi:hypothetical protein
MAKNLYTGPDTHVSPDQSTNVLFTPASEPSSYPKWKYHAENSAVVIGSPDEEASLGAEWKDSPAEFGKAE